MKKIFSVLSIATFISLAVGCSGEGETSLAGKEDSVSQNQAGITRTDTDEAKAQSQSYKLVIDNGRGISNNQHTERPAFY